MRPELREDGAEELAHAIRTTDALDKHVALDVELPDGTVRLTAQAKGAGMIQPSFATMLCFVQTDAILSAETCDLLLGVCVKRSFDRISVDGQLSTNDTAILMASRRLRRRGRAGERGRAALRRGARRAAAPARAADRRRRRGVAADRPRRRARRGAAGRRARRARYVANSPLVKTALYGGDPNWGRIAQAIGARAHRHPPARSSTSPSTGRPCAAAARRPATSRAFEGDEVEIEIGLPGDGAETEVFFSDLGHEYITINADYTT